MCEALEDMKREVKEEGEIKIYRRIPAEAQAIRQEVFVREQGFEYEFDDIDNIANHLVMYERGEAIATCRIYWNEGRHTYIVGRIAVISAYRGKQVGAQILHEAARQVKALGGKTLYLHAQCRASGFYEKQGYQKIGEIELEEDCPHIWMYKKL